MTFADPVSPILINYDSPLALRAFLDEHGLGMRKKLGQNFLVNPVIRSKLIDGLELSRGDCVWEIGPGLGAMTKGLLEKGSCVTAFEIDPAFIRALKEFFPAENPEYGINFRIVEGDVFKTWREETAEFQEKNKELLLLGNLPYNIAAALMADFIEHGWFFKRMVVTVQREVAVRMYARPSSPEYSSFSVLCSSVYKVTPLMVIKGASFYPAPKVDSQGVSLDLLPSRIFPALLYPLVRNLFSSRRKTIRNTLSQYVSSVIMTEKESGRNFSPSEIAADLFEKSGISGDRRAETLDIDEFTALAAALEETIQYGR